VFFKSIREPPKKIEASLPESSDVLETSEIQLYRPAHLCRFKQSLDHGDIHTRTPSETSGSFPNRTASAISSTSPIYNFWPLILIVSVLSPRVSYIFSLMSGLNGLGMLNVPSLYTTSMKE